jgi:hypothetical protein
MKGSPKAAIVPGSGQDWNNTPLDRFNKFSMQPVSAWPVGDGTLGTFSSPVKSHQLFAHQLRDLGEFGVTNSTASDKLDLKHPTWKTPVVPEIPLVRVPKRMRLGIAGGELGPAFVQ